MEQHPRNQHAQHGVNDKLAQWVKEAEYYVEGNPRECEPPCPVLPQQQAGAAHNSQQFRQLNSDCVAVSGGEARESGR
jgi:hypothetical protein